MLGINIFLHSLRQVTGNIGMAVRVSLWFVILVAIGTVGMFSAVFADPNQPSFDGVATLLGFGFAIFFVWGGSLIAVVWHRYILLEEVPQSAIPYRSGLNIWTYFWYTFGIAIILVVVTMILTMVLGLIIFPNTPLKSAIFSIILGSVLVVLFYRLALILPAVAIDKKLSLADAMHATRSAMGPILVLAVVVVIFNTILSQIVGFLFNGDQANAMLRIENDQIIYTEISGMGILYFIANGLVQWFSLMLSVSILSTLYGHFVEKRGLG